MAGGITPGDCLVAYKPIGAASLADSYVNLANPGTNNAAEGTAPTWDVSDGWIFNGSSQWLSSGIVIPNNQTYSMFIRYKYISTTYSRAVSLARVAGGANTCDFGIYRPTANQTNYYSGSFKTENTSIDKDISVIQGIAGAYCYFNGVASAVITAGSGVNTVAQPIGAMDSSGTRSIHFPGKIQAFVIYQTTLTASQVMALTIAMSAL